VRRFGGGAAKECQPPGWRSLAQRRSGCIYALRPKGCHPRIPRLAPFGGRLALRLQGSRVDNPRVLSVSTRLHPYASATSGSHPEPPAEPSRNLGFSGERPSLVNTPGGQRQSRTKRPGRRAVRQQSAAPLTRAPRAARLQRRLFAGMTHSLAETCWRKQRPSRGRSRHICGSSSCGGPARPVSRMDRVLWGACPL